MLGVGWFRRAESKEGGEAVEVERLRQQGCRLWRSKLQTWTNCHKHGIELNFHLNLILKYEACKLSELFLNLFS